MLVLYHHGSSVCAAKVRLALAEKNLPWEGRYIDILKGDQFTPEFRKLNPKAVVPVLIDEDNVVTESTVINEYLEERFPEPSIFPADALARARMRVWTKAVDEALHPACAALTFITSHRFTIAKLGPEKMKQFLDSTPALSVTPTWKAQKRAFVEQGFDAPGAHEMIRLYDYYMRKADEDLREGPWLAGKTFSAADMSLIPYVNRLDMLGLSGLWEGGRLPRLNAWWQSATARSSFKPQILDWIPEELTNDLRSNGPKSWPEIKRIVGIST
jgi:glutathione S-transferase